MGNMIRKQIGKVIVVGDKVGDMKHINLSKTHFLSQPQVTLAGTLRTFLLPYPPKFYY